MYFWNVYADSKKSWLASAWEIYFFLSKKVLQISQYYDHYESMENPHKKILRLSNERAWKDDQIEYATLEVYDQY